VRWGRSALSWEGRLHPVLNGANGFLEAFRGIDHCKNRDFEKRYGMKVANIDHSIPACPDNLRIFVI
jgi:hypothetical protein